MNDSTKRCGACAACRRKNGTPCRAPVPRATSERQRGDLGSQTELADRDGRERDESTGATRALYDLPASPSAAAVRAVISAAVERAEKAHNASMSLMARPLLDGAASGYGVGELARLAEEAKAVAAELEKARASRAEKDEREKPNLDDVASDELARRVHSEMNASPRLSRGGERAAASPSAVVAPPA